MAVQLRLVAWLALAALLLLGCQSSRNVPELLTLSEIVPRTIGPNDRIDVIGRNLPVGQVGQARVVFRGDLHRPGRPPLVDQVIEVEDARLERDRISFEIDDLVLERFAGAGDGASHTTFRGRVEAWLPGASSSMPVFGSLKGEVVLDILPREASRPVRDAREEEARAAHAFFGWELEPADGHAGLLVRSVRPDGPAARAGIGPGDVLIAFEGVSVLDVTDVVPAPLDDSCATVLQRDGKRIETITDARGYRGEVQSGLAEGVVVLGSLLLVLLIFGSRAGKWTTWLAHRMKEKIVMHRSPGGGLVGALVRTAVRDVRGAREAEGLTVARLAPLLVFAGVSLAFALLPLVELKGRTELDIGILYLVSVTALLTMGLLTGGWGSAASPVWGRLRAIVEVVVCELPAACALGAVVMITGSLRVRDVVLAQVGSSGSVLETGGWPWQWNALKSPQLFLLFGLFFVTALVDGAERRTTTATGASRSDSPAFFFAEWVHVFVMCALAAIAFLGGYAVPGVSTQELHGSVALQIAGCALFLLKCWLLALVVLLLRASLPRIRPRVLLRLGVRVLLPASVIGVALTVLTLHFPLLPVAQRTLGLITLITVTVTVLLLGAAVFAAVRAVRVDDTRFRARVNPFL